MIWPRKTDIIINTNELVPYQIKKKVVHFLLFTNYIVILSIIIYNNIYIQFILYNLYILSDEDYAWKQAALEGRVPVLHRGAYVKNPMGYGDSYEDSGGDDGEVSAIDGA